MTFLSKILQKTKCYTSLNNPFFFLDSVKVLGYQIQNNPIHPLKSKKDGFLKLQPPKKETQNYVGFLTFISIYICSLQLILRLFYLNFRDTTDFKWTSELQQTFDKVRKEHMDGTLRLAVPNIENPFLHLMRCL